MGVVALGGAGFVALGGASLAAEERGAAKPRGRGLGQRNRKMDFAFLKQNVLLFILHQEENT